MTGSPNGLPIPMLIPTSDLTLSYLAETAEAAEAEAPGAATAISAPTLCSEDKLAKNLRYRLYLTGLRTFQACSTSK